MDEITYQYAERTARMKASIIREILKVSSHSDVISFAGGLPAPEAFPVKQFEQAMKDAIRIDGVKALQYTITEGHAGLKKVLCAWLKKRGIDGRPENLLFTNGSQQALDLLGKIFLNPGDEVLVEDPTYLGAIQNFNSYQVGYITVPMDDEGMPPEAVEAKLKQKKPRFIYVVPTFHNPAGITMSLPRRRALLEIAARYRVPIIEDDPYSFIRFKGEPVPSLFELAKGKGVIYISTFSKLLSPGIRLGFVLAEPDVIKYLVYAKQATDLQANTFIQYAVYHYCRRGYLEKHIPAIIKEYKHRAGVMLNAMARHFPKEVHYVEPQGGMFVWCRLPSGIKASDVFEKALKQNVAFVVGTAFYANGGGDNTFRLNFTNMSDVAINKGIALLGDVIRTFL
ncbi:MAG: PLP-dependent aminotransferase family protein [Elusimicrobia bacterium]|nr:PLP-dependent aminotransferase family protein [Candidatus Obscuribacterium magneticum]